MIISLHRTPEETKYRLPVGSPQISYPWHIVHEAGSRSNKSSFFVFLKGKRKRYCFRKDSQDGMAFFQFGLSSGPLNWDSIRKEGGYNG